MKTFKQIWHTVKLPLIAIVLISSLMTHAFWAISGTTDPDFVFPPLRFFIGTVLFMVQGVALAVVMHIINSENRKHD